MKRAAEVAKQTIKSQQGRRIAAAETVGPVAQDGGAASRYRSAGELRKVGPSLRHVGGEEQFRVPLRLDRRPAPVPAQHQDAAVLRFARSSDGDGLAVAKEFEPVEVRAISEYLLGASQPFEYLKPADDAKGSAERGKKVFEMRGCLACHSHADFPDGKATHGPDLSRIGAKLADERER